MANALFDPQTRTYRDEMGNEIPFRALNLYRVIDGPTAEPMPPAPPTFSTEPPAGVAPPPALAAPMVAAPSVSPMPAPQPNAVEQVSPMGPGALTPSQPEPGALTPPIETYDRGVLMGQPQPQEGLFSFMNNPGASDALVAFGSAMLRGNTFNEGLANAAEAVNKVSQRYRPISEVEINNLRQRAAIKMMLEQEAAPPPSASYKTSQVGYAPGIGYVPTRFNELTGLTEYQLPNGTVTTQMPEGFQQRTDAGVGEDNTYDAQAYRDDWKNLQPLMKNINQFDAMISLAPRVNAGGDALSTVKRTVNSFLGTDFGANLSDVEYFEKLNNDAQLEIAQGQKGLGQFTEMERAIVARSIPNIGTQEATIVQVGARLKVQAQMKAELIQEWASMPDAEKRNYGGYRSYVATKLREYQTDYQRRYEEEITRIAQTRGGAQGNQGPEVGTVQQGYRFKGGNPADKNNWEKVN